MHLVTFQDQSLIVRLVMEMSKRKCCDIEQMNYIEIMEKLLSNKQYFDTVKNKNIFVKGEENTRISELEQPLYDILTLTMRKSLNDESIKFPIWCWIKPKNKDIKDKNYIDELYDRCVPRVDSLCMIELFVPNELVQVTNFNLWMDLRFKTHFKNSISKDDLNELFVKKKGTILQAQIPYLDISFIKSIKFYNDPYAEDYPGTYRELDRLKKEGKLKLDENGFLLSQGEKPIKDKLDIDDYEL